MWRTSGGLEASAAARSPKNAFSGPNYSSERLGAHDEPQPRINERRCRIAPPPAARPTMLKLGSFNPTLLVGVNVGLREAASWFPPLIHFLAPQGSTTSRVTTADN